MADLLFTDPPYGVAYQTKLSKEEAVARRRRTDGLEIGNDNLGHQGTRDLIAESLGVVGAHLRKGASFYICCPGGDLETIFRLALLDAGWELRQEIIWVKDVFVMGRQDYHWRHENLLYGWIGGAKHYFGGGRSLDTVWEVDRPKRSKEHPTMKPVDLVERALGNSSEVGQTALDPFLGSGSTVIAAERLGRVCYGTEIDPGYCDVVVERWENFTGGKAKRVKS